MAVWMLLASLLPVSVSSLEPLVRQDCACCEQSVCRKAQPRFASENFVIHAPSTSARAVAAQAESLRLELGEQWLGKTPVRWSPRCEIVVHASQASYLQAVGAGGRHTTGASLLSFDANGRVASRRIDLWGRPRARALEALAHELTHVLLADRFGKQQLPRWADEGIAMQADGQEKLLLHRRDLGRGLENGSLFRTVELIQMEHYPRTDARRLFYGQSVSLVSFLSERGGSAKFVVFLERAMQSGYDRALRETYAIDNVAKLERLWREHISGAPANLY